MKRIFAIIIVIIMLFTFSACSGGSDDTRPAGGATTTVQAGGTATTTRAERTTTQAGAKKDLGLGDEVVEITSFYRAESAFELASVASEIDYTYIVRYAENETKENTYSFRVLDEKQIDGELAYHISFEVNIDGKEGGMEAWIVESDILEATIDGEKKTGNALLPVTVTLQSYLQPYILNTLFSEIISKPPMQTVYRWTLDNEDTKTINFSSGKLDLLCLEYIVAEQKLYFEIASIDGKNMFINTITTRDGVFYEFTTTHFIPNR